MKEKKIAPFSALGERELIGEVMDQEGLSRQELSQALSGLARINFVSLAARQIWNQLKKHLTQNQKTKISILDLASGGGDTLFSLEKFAQNDGIELEGLGLDIKGESVDISRQSALAKKSKILFEKSDVVKDTLPVGYDFIICSLFLHHLKRDDVLTVLKKMYQGANSAIIISDLRRSRAAYISAWLITRILSRSRIVHIDGPLSIRAAFTIEEARELARELNLPNFSVVPVVGCRFILTAHKKV